MTNKCVGRFSDDSDCAQSSNTISTKTDLEENIKTTRIPERLMWDSNNQFLIDNPSQPVFDPNKPLPDDIINTDPNNLVQPELDEWFLYDSWSIQTACKLITIGYPVNLEYEVEEAKDLPFDCDRRHRLNSMLYVYERALGIASSSIRCGTIKEYDTPMNWIDWAKNKGYSVEHLPIGLAIIETEQAKAKPEVNIYLDESDCAQSSNTLNDKTALEENKVIERENNFNVCIDKMVKKFIQLNKFKPNADNILEGLKSNPPSDHIVSFDDNNKTLSIDGASPKSIVKIKRSIKSIIGKH